MSIAARALRETYRRELLPARARWWLAAQGLCDWYRIVARELAPHVPDARRTVAELCARTFERRYAHLRSSRPELPDAERDPRALALCMSALYRMDWQPKARWLFDGVGGAARGLERWRAQRLIAGMDADARWREVTIHLGEWLIVVTEELPPQLPRARQIVADICFRMGARYGEQMQRMFGLPEDGDAPARAIEVLRMSEYIFRVNPEHWGESSARDRTGYLEGTACPWYDRPGWQQVHCGIFGQFQSGISSVFGLSYHLTTTIPKHGGGTCRIDLRPIQLKRKAG